MITRRRAGSVFVMAMLVLAGCTDESSPRSQASPSELTPPAISETSSPEQLASEDAKAAFEEMLRVTDEASQQPGSRDWEPVIRQYAADPAALLSVQSVRDYVSLGLRQEGNSRVDVEVAAVDLAAQEGPTVRLTGCFDSQSTQVVNVETGETVPPGTPPRYVWDITVLQYFEEPGKPWLVSTLEPRTDKPC